MAKLQNVALYTVKHFMSSKFGTDASNIHSTELVQKSCNLILAAKGKLSVINHNISEVFVYFMKSQPLTI